MNTQHFVISNNMLNRRIGDEIKPTRLDSAIILLICVKKDTEYGLIVYNISPDVWKTWYPFFVAHSKFIIDNFNETFNTYGELIQRYNELFEKEYVNEQGFSFDRRKLLLIDEFKKLHNLDFIEVESITNLNPLYEIKYSKSKNVYTLYRFETFVLRSVGDKEKLLHHNEYIQDILPLNTKGKFKHLDIASNLEALINDNNVIDELKKCAIEI